MVNKTLRILQVSQLAGELTVIAAPIFTFLKKCKGGSKVENVAAHQLEFGSEKFQMVVVVVA